MGFQGEGEPRPWQAFSMDFERPGCGDLGAGRVIIDGRSCHELTGASTLGAVGARGQKGEVGRRIIWGHFPRFGGRILSVPTLSQLLPSTG